MRIVPTCTQVVQFGDDGMVHCSSSLVSTWTSDVTDHVHCDCCESLLPVGGSGDGGGHNCFTFLYCGRTLHSMHWVCFNLYDHAQAILFQLPHI